MTTREAIAFVRRHGVVLESARGPVPSLAEAIAGAPIRGSWWCHARGEEIFELTRAVRDSDQVLVCRLVNGKITFVHQRLWPALVRASGHFPRKNLAQLCESHTASGRHTLEEVPFPTWVPASLRKTAAGLSEPKALLALGRVLD